jgi:RNA polymerase sigma factor (TIGR02999 family)
MDGPHSFTDLIQRARHGDAAALQGVFDVAYTELRSLARVRLRKSGRNALLDTTALVHEAYLRFANAGRLNVDDRAHFLRYASHAMRSVIVDTVRERVAARRGGGAPHVTLNSEVDRPADASETEILRVHEALEELALRDARLVQVVEMRYFAGMTDAEVGAALGLNERTVRRDWEKARLLLAEALR